MTVGERTTNPVLIIGTERSGSNLLRLVLNAHPRIAVPHPPHFLRFLGPLAPSYGSLEVEANRRRFARDALLLLRSHPHPWGCDIDEDAVVAESVPTPFGVVAAIHDQYRAGQGKARWGCKSTFMVDHVDDVLAECADARFVWLVRDPRDVAASASRSVFGPYHPYRTAQLWADQQRAGRAACERLGPEVVHLLRYEDLVSRPETEVARLCQFLGEPLAPAMLQHERSLAARETATLSESWRRAGDPVDGARVGRHRRDLDAVHRAQVELAAGPLMEALGYPLEGAGSPPLAVAVGAWELRRRFTVEWRSLRHDANHFRRWRRGATVGWLRLKARVRRPAPMSTDAECS